MNNQQESNRAPESLKTCYDLEYLLLGDLRQLLTEPQTAQTRQSLLVILDRLLLNLPEQLVLACEEGYLSEVLEQRPNWHRQIEALHGANMACISALDESRNRVERNLPFAAIANELSCNLRHWMQSLVAIREHETRLLQKAFTLDIGGEA